MVLVVEVEGTQRLKCSCFLVMAYFFLGMSIYYPKKTTFEPVVVRARLGRRLRDLPAGEEDPRSC